MITSTCLTTSLSLTTLKPSMLRREGRIREWVLFSRFPDVWETLHICADKSFLHSYQAWRAQMGSTSVTYRTEPSALRAAQQPLPTYEEREKERRHRCSNFKLHNSSFLFKTGVTLKQLYWPHRIHTPPPAFLQTWRQWFSSTWGEEFNCQIPAPVFVPVYHHNTSPHPSSMDSLQQYRLSNFCLVTESFTLMAGMHSLPALDSWYNLKQPQTHGVSWRITCRERLEHCGKLTDELQ